MARRIRARGARALLPLLVVLPSSMALSAMTPARAQDVTPTVTLELLSQTPWVEPGDPRFTIRVLARNAGTAVIDDLDVRVEIGPSFISRFDYEASLLTGPTTVLHAERFRFGGSIQPGNVRSFAVRPDPSAIPILNEMDSRVHPMRVEVRSRGQVIGSLNTSLVWIVRTPERPVSFAWWTEIDAPLPLDAAGTLADPGFEASIDGGGGVLAAQVAAIADLARRDPEVPIDVVIRPALLEQLVRMSDGYERTSGVQVPVDASGARNASELLRTLGDAAASDAVQISAMPFAGPSVPSLLSGNLQVELEGQRQLGNEWTNEAIGVEPAVAVARPPGGMLSEQALAWYAGKGARTLLADVGAVDRPPQPNEFAPPSTATVATGRGDVALILPDPGTQALLERADLLADPVRAAQAVFAELAVIWREQPVPPDQPDGTPTQRGLALSLPPNLPAAMWRPLMGRLAGAPFLRHAHAQDHAADVVPAGDPADLRDPSGDVFSTDYADGIRRLRREVEDLASMLSEPSPQPERLRRNIYVAESLAFLTDELAGQAWLASVDDATTEAFERVTPELQVFTLTSREGDLPLLMQPSGPVPVHVAVELQSALLEFPEGNRRDVVLEPGRQQVVTFAVVSNAAGQHEIRVIVEAPSGRVVSDQRAIVRSTALNAIAIVVTGAAALVLFALWARRWVRRRRT